MVYLPTCCRVCLNEGDIHIFHEENLGDIAGAIFMLTSIEVCPDDTLPKYICHACNETLQTALLFRQMAQESDTLLKKKPEYSILIKHMNTEMKKESETSIIMKDMIPECNEEPTNSIEENNKLLNRGIKKKQHMKALSMKMCKKYKNIFKSSVEAGVMFNCNKCSLEFTSSNDYGRHMLTEEHKNIPDICPFCHREYKCILTHLNYHRRYTTDLCSICGQSFLSVIFARHQESHFDDLPLKCPICPYQGRFANDLKVHLRRHTGEKPYKCSLCPVSFTNKSNLNRHTARHERAYKFICDICMKGFYNQHDFESHQYTHSDIKLFSCDDCTKSFPSKKALMKHTRQVHNREKLRSGRLPNYIKIQNEKMV